MFFFFSQAGARVVACCWMPAGAGEIVALRLLSSFSWMTRSGVDVRDAFFVAVDGFARLLWVRRDWKLLQE